MNHKEMGWGNLTWIDLAQERDRLRALLSAVMNLRNPSNARNFLASWAPASFSERTLLHRVR